MFLSMEGSRPVAVGDDHEALGGPAVLEGQTVKQAVPLDPARRARAGGFGNSMQERKSLNLLVRPGLPYQVRPMDRLGDPRLGDKLAMALLPMSL